METVKNTQDSSASLDRAVALHRAGDLAGAEDLYRRILSQTPGDSSVQSNLGVCLKSQGRYDEAETVLREAIRLAPDNFAPWANLANVISARGDKERAANLLNTQAQAFVARNRRDLAEKAYRHALSLLPESPQLWGNMGNHLMNEERYEEAEKALKRALQLRPRYVRALIHMGNLVAKMGNPQGARRYFEIAMEAEPGSPSVIHDFAIFLKLQGNLDEAKEYFRQALAIRPDFIPSLIEFGQIEKFKPGDGHLEALEKLVETDGPERPQLHRTGLIFALAKSYNDAKLYDKAFETVNKGCALHRKTISYSTEKMTQYMDMLKRAFAPELFERLSQVGDPDETPVFVLGMPRSGTTLTDQIIVSHPRAGSVGETETLRGIWNSFLSREARPLTLDTIAAIQPEKLREQGRFYVDFLRKAAPDALRIVEKEPSNFLRVGLIQLILPNSRILHCVRNPIDTCVSCYFLKFHGDAQPFTYDLTELGEFFRGYLDMMDYWREIFPGRILDVVYEDTIADQEAQSRRILEHLGLDWDDRVLAFHETSRSVLTNSLAQVKQPIYKDSLERWRRYEKHLDPLFKALGDDVLERFGINR